ncbi:MAG: HepT-like ribonuclease domain-containing protein [Planctomycetaceae bacterium]
MLDDIRDAAAFIRQVTHGRALEHYRADRLLRQAVERNFEMIGEAVGRLARDDPETAARIGQYPQIIAFRNLLIHGYDLIDDAQVWQVITADLPTLENEVAALLKECEPECEPE